MSTTFDAVRQCSCEASQRQKQYYDRKAHGEDHTCYVPGGVWEPPRSSNDLDKGHIKSCLSDHRRPTWYVSRNAGKGEKTAALASSRKLVLVLTNYGEKNQDQQTKSSFPIQNQIAHTSLSLSILNHRFFCRVIRSLRMHLFSQAVFSLRLSTGVIGGKLRQLFWSLTFIISDLGNSSPDVLTVQYQLKPVYLTLSRFSLLTAYPLWKRGWGLCYRWCRRACVQYEHRKQRCFWGEGCKQDETTVGS